MGADDGHLNRALDPWEEKKEIDFNLNCHLIIDIEFTNQPSFSLIFIFIILCDMDYYLDSLDSIKD